MARYQLSEREARYHSAREWGHPPIVTEGDSWFSYEFYLNMADRIDDTKRFALKRLESSGDTMENMVGDKLTSKGVNGLKKVVQVERPVLLFFSGGGNDIVGEELAGAFDPGGDAAQPESFIATDKWDALMTSLTTSYQVLIDTIGPLCPIFAHGYDNFVPSDKPVKIFPGFTLGPYVLPQMRAQGVAVDDPTLQQEISIAMVADFNARLQQLEHDNAGYFGYVDLRGIVGNDRWENEIHPKKAAFADLAEAFLAGVDAKLPALRAARAAKLGAIIT